MSNKCFVCDGVYPDQVHDFENCGYAAWPPTWDLMQLSVLFDTYLLIEKKNETPMSGSEIAKSGLLEEKFMAQLIMENTEIANTVLRLTGSTRPTTPPRVLKGNKKTDIVWGGINIQHKKTSGTFQQICRHWLKNLYKKIRPPEEAKKMLDELCQLPLMSDGRYVDKSVHVKKLNDTNYTEHQLEILRCYFEDNKHDIITYAFLGDEMAYAPHVLSCTLFQQKIRTNIRIWNMCDAIQYICGGRAKIRKSGTVVEIGECFTFQRKGGDNGKKESNQFQFKINMCKLPLKNNIDQIKLKH